jgi:hypothetical protein
MRFGFVDANDRGHPQAERVFDDAAAHAVELGEPPRPRPRVGVAAIPA